MEITNIESFLAYYARIRSRTKKVIACIPADKLEWTYRKGKFTLGRLNPNDLNGKCQTPMGTPITVWKWLRALIKHEVHHRGNIYTYLGMLEIPTPPLYGLTSEEVADIGSKD